MKASGHLSVAGPEAIGLLEVDADLAVGGAPDGIEGERRPQHVAMQPLQRAEQVRFGESFDRPKTRFPLMGGLKAAIGDQRMQVDEETQVVAEALHHDEQPGVQGSAAR